MAYTVVQKCPQTFLDWSDQASSTCNSDTYHCVADEYSRVVEVCTTPLWIEAGHCPVYNTVAKKMDSVICSGKNCPKEVYRSDAVYKYQGCQLFASGTTSTSLQVSTLLTSTYRSNIFNSSIIAGSVIPVLVVIVLVVLGLFLWRKKRAFVTQLCCLCRGREQMQLTEGTCESEKFIENDPDISALEENTPKELDILNGFIYQCEKCLEKSNMVVMFGKLGTGKRTLATQIAIRLAKKEPKSKIRIVGENDLISKDFKFMLSTILIIQDPVKTCYTVNYTEDIINRLLKLCQTAAKNNSYILVLFHRDDLDSLYRQFGKMKTSFQSMFEETVFRIPDLEQILKEIAFSYTKKCSNDEIQKIQKENSGVGQLIILVFNLKNPELYQDRFLSNPIESIIGALKILEMSPDIQNQSAFKLMVYVILQGGEIAKCRLKDIPQHILFDNLRGKMDGEKIFNACIDKLLKCYVEESADGRSYRVLHDVITKCTVISAVENYMTLLLTECDLILLFDCIRLKSITEKVKYHGELVYDYSKLKIAIPTETLSTIARISFKRKEIIDAFKKITLFENEGLQIMWNKEHALRLKYKGDKKPNKDT